MYIELQKLNFNIFLHLPNNRTEPNTEQWSNKWVSKARDTVPLTNQKVVYNGQFLILN